MTIKQLLALPTEDISRLSDKELYKILSPFFPKARKVDKTDKQATRQLQAEADRLIKQLGL